MILYVFDFSFFKKDFDLSSFSFRSTLMCNSKDFHSDVAPQEVIIPIEMRFTLIVNLELLIISDRQKFSSFTSKKDVFFPHLVIQTWGSKFIVVSCFNHAIESC